MCDFEYRGLQASEMEYDYETQTIRCMVVVFDELGEEWLDVSAPCAIESAVIEAVDAYCTKHKLEHPKPHVQWMHEQGLAGCYYEVKYPEARSAVD